MVQDGSTPHWSRWSPSECPVVVNDPSLVHTLQKFQRDGRQLKFAIFKHALPVHDIGRRHIANHLRTCGQTRDTGNRDVPSKGGKQLHEAPRVVCFLQTLDRRPRAKPALYTGLANHVGFRAIRIPRFVFISVIRDDQNIVFTVPARPWVPFANGQHRLH